MMVLLWILPSSLQNPTTPTYLRTSLDRLFKDLPRLMFPCWPSLTLSTFPLEACILMSLLGQLLHLRRLLFLWRSLFSTGLLIRFRVERSQPLKIALLMRVLKSLLIVPPWSMREINRTPDPTFSLMRLRQYLRSFYPPTRL